MSDLKPLDIVDDRTIEQIRTDGDARWPDGSPYILKGVCCACGETGVNETHMCLTRLNTPALCSGCCEKPAHWAVNDMPVCDACIRRIASERNGEWLLDALVDIADRHQGQMTKIEPTRCEMGLLSQHEQCAGTAYWRASGYAECDEHIMQCVEWHPDSRETLTEALADIRERHLKTGSRVRILTGDERGNLGTVYNQAFGRPAPWHVRPDRWASDCPGIAYQSDELDVML